MTSYPDQTKVITPSQIRSFAFPLGGIFALIGLWPWIWQGTGVRIWSLVLSGGLIIPGLVYPRLLTPAYRGWMTFAERLAWFNTRLLLGIIFYGILTPMGLLRGLFGKTTLTCGFDKQAKTYRVVKSTRATDHMAKSF